MFAKAGKGSGSPAPVPVPPPPTPAPSWSRPPGRSWVMAMIKSQFYTRKALVWTPGSTNPGAPATCAVSDVGMIGLHIATKVENTPQWVWSTFEHRNNVPDLSSLPAKQPYSFYNQNCKDCTPVNKPPPRPWDPNKPGQPTQIARVTADRRPDHGAEQVLAGGPGLGQSELALAVLRSYQHPMADADVERLQRAVADQPGRQSGAAVSRQHHAGKLHPGQRSQYVVKLHRVPQERRRDDRQVLRLHVHAVDGKSATPATTDQRRRPPWRPARHQPTRNVPMPISRPRSPVPWMRPSRRRLSSPFPRL